MTAFAATLNSAIQPESISGYNLTTVKILRWIAVLAGLVMFGVSFILPAVREVKAAASSPGVPGFTCATLTLTMPWGKDGHALLQQSPVQYFSILLSGWINPLFVVALLPALIKPRSRPTAILVYLVTLMQVFCWIVFFQLHLYPRYGYFLWLFGMLLALYSNKIFLTKSTKQTTIKTEHTVHS